MKIAAVLVKTTIGVESHQRRGDVRELADTLVDTGSEYSWVPAPHESLRLAASKSPSSAPD